MQFFSCIQGVSILKIFIMRIQASRHSINQSRALFDLCLTEGRLDEEKMRHLIEALKKNNSRNLRDLLAGLWKRIEHHIREHTAILESAGELSSDEVNAIFSQMEKHEGPFLKRNYRANPQLIGGMRIQIGSNVWDGSIANRLQQLQESVR